MTKYVHTNIVCKDIIKLSQFYINVFGCKQPKAESILKGEWVEKGTGVKDAKIKSIVLELPGYGKDGPTLELFEYSEIVDDRQGSIANRKGLGHLAFSVENVEIVLEKTLQNGGYKLGEITKSEFKSGTLAYIYLTDPEGNIIEIQSWVPKNI